MVCVCTRERAMFYLKHQCTSYANVLNSYDFMWSGDLLNLSICRKIHSLFLFFCSLCIGKLDFIATYNSANTEYRINSKRIQCKIAAYTICVLYIHLCSFQQWMFQFAWKHLLTEYWVECVDIREDTSKRMCAMLMHTVYMYV